MLDTEKLDLMIEMKSDSLEFKYTGKTFSGAFTWRGRHSSEGQESVRLVCWNKRKELVLRAACRCGLGFWMLIGFRCMSTCEGTQVSLPCVKEKLSENILALMGCLVLFEDG